MKRGYPQLQQNVSSTIEPIKVAADDETANHLTATTLDAARDVDNVHASASITELAPPPVLVSNEEREREFDGQVMHASTTLDEDVS